MTGSFGQTVVTAGAIGFAVFFVVVTAGAGVVMFVVVAVVVTAGTGVVMFVFVVVTAGTSVSVFVFSHFLLTFLSFFSFGLGLILRFGVQLNPDLPFLVAGAHNETILG